jgi:arylformamidase
MPRIIDISPPITERLAVWPGDAPFRRKVALSIAEGANIDLSAIDTTVHLGAHADAPSHYVAGGDDIARRPLELYYGPCQVVRVEVGRGERVTPAHLRDEVTAPRVLVRTATFPDPTRWNDDFASLSPALIDHLAARGVVLVGIDTPSVDPFDDKVLETHQALARHGMANLEGLVLDHVAPGRYTLIALPLPLVGADASPVRAALVAHD